MTNPARNEVIIRLNNKEYKTRATFNFICEVEDQFDLPLTNIVVERLNTGKVKAKEIAAVIAAGIRATGETVDMDTLTDDIAATGTVVAINEIIPLLMVSFSGPATLKKK
jgi:hypothetical protein